MLDCGRQPLKNCVSLAAAQPITRLARKSSCMRRQTLTSGCMLVAEHRRPIKVCHQRHSHKRPRRSDRGNFPPNIEAARAFGDDGDARRRPGISVLRADPALPLVSIVGLGAKPAVEAGRQHGGSRLARGTCRPIGGRAKQRFARASSKTPLPKTKKARSRASNT